MNLPPPYLYHPLLVHFPIALLLTGTLCYVLSLIGQLHWLRTPAIVMGVMGSVLGFVAKQTGEIAEKVVSLNLCNMELLEKHASQAETALIFFAVVWGVAALSHLLRGRFFFPTQHPIGWNLILVFGMFMGSAYLVLSGHKGFQLVYEEGAAVRGPIHSCTQ